MNVVSVLARTWLATAGFAAVLTAAVQAEVRLQRIVPAAVMPGRCCLTASPTMSPTRQKGCNAVCGFWKIIVMPRPHQGMNWR